MICCGQVIGVRGRPGVGWWGNRIGNWIKKEIQNKIDELSDIEKLLVVDYILADFDKPDPEIDKLWAKEALRRQKAMRSGKMKVHSYDEVMRKYLK